MPLTALLLPRAAPVLRASCVTVASSPTAAQSLWSAACHRCWSRTGRLSVHRSPVRCRAMATGASDKSSERIRTDNTAAASTVPAASSSSPPPSSFLWAGYTLPYPSTPPSPLPDFYSLSSWPSDPLRVFMWWYGEAESYYASVASARSNCWQAVSWPNNMQLATQDGSGQPHVRNVLLKGVDGAGLIFFTNRQGNKGRQLAVNRRAAVVFYWKGLERQVRVEGDMCEVSDEESDGYFHSRPVGSQVSAAVSPQSRTISSRAALELHYVDQLNKLTQAAAGSTASDIAPNSVHIASLPSSQSPPPTSASTAHSHHQHALSSLAHIEQQLGESGRAGQLQQCIQRPSEWGGYRLIPRLFEFWEDGQYRLHSRVEYSRRDGGSSSEQQPLTTAQSEWDKRFLAP